MPLFLVLLLLPIQAFTWDFKHLTETQRETAPPSFPFEGCGKKSDSKKFLLPTVSVQNALLLRLMECSDEKVRPERQLARCVNELNPIYEDLNASKAKSQDIYKEQLIHLNKTLNWYGHNIVMQPRYEKEVWKLNEKAPWKEIIEPTIKKWDQLNKEQDSLVEENGKRIEAKTLGEEYEKTKQRINEIKKELAEIFPIASSAILYEDPRAVFELFGKDPAKFKKMQQMLFEESELLFRYANTREARNSEAVNATQHELEQVFGAFNDEENEQVRVLIDQWGQAYKSKYKELVKSGSWKEIQEPFSFSPTTLDKEALGALSLLNEKAKEGMTKNISEVGRELEFLKGLVSKKDANDLHLCAVGVKNSAGKIMHWGVSYLQGKLKDPTSPLILVKTVDASEGSKKPEKLFDDYFTEKPMSFTQIFCESDPRGIY